MKVFTIIIAFTLMLPLYTLAQANIIPFGSSWKYLDNGTDQGTAWREAAFNDSNWKTGNGKFGYDYDNLATTVSYGPNSSNKYITTYFRKSFSISNIDSYSSFTINVYRDDALIVYINGTEVFRDNLPTGSVTFNTLALKSSNGNSSKSRSIPKSVFQNGDNIIAVEVHQQKTNSSDLMFDLELTGVQTNPPSNQSPSVGITSPANNSTFAVNQSITVNASASDPEGSLSKVEFFVNNSKVGEDATNPYSINWSAGSPGQYVLSAVATDGAGLTATSAGVNVTITSDTPPTDTTPPAVSSINRHTPSSQTTSATAVTYRVSFSEQVTGVDWQDFTVVTASGNASGTLANNAVATIGTGDNTYDVTVSSITGQGSLRLDLKSSGTGITDAAGNAIAGGFTGGQTYTIQPAGGGSGNYGFASVSSVAPVPIAKHTAEKPQSKVWKHADRWWAVLPDADGTFIWRLDGSTWVKVLELASTSSARSDCKVVGNLVHVLLFREGSTSYLLSAQYDAASTSYKLWSQRTARVSLDLESYAETATIDVDGTGRMWLATDGQSTVNVRWSDAPYAQWSSPIVLASNITEDDICAVVAMPGKVGLLWSNQNTKRFGFKTHQDGASPGEWTNDEVPASQSALDVRAGMADDHINMAIASDGTLYCAVKTGYDTQGYTRIALMVRRPAGSWDNIYTVTDIEGTRPMVILNESLGKLKIVYTESESGGDIYYKESSTSSIMFGERRTLFSGGDYNYATSTKQNYSAEVVIIVTNESGTRRAESVLASDVAGSNITAEATATAVSLISNADQGADLLAYPNPFSSKTTLSFTPSTDGEFTISLYDSKGAVVKELKQGTTLAGQVHEVEIDGSALAKGLYIVRMQAVNEAKSLRLVLER